MLRLRPIHVLIAAVLTVIPSLLPSALPAQAVAGVGADAIALPRRSTRLRIAGLWDSYDRVYTDSGSRPYLASLATTTLGVQRLPQLNAAEQAIRALSGNSSFLLSLGTLEASGDRRRAITPMALDVGITARVSVGIVVPYVESRDNALLILNRTGSSATVGRNPAYTNPSARSTNGSVLRQLALARAALTSEVTRCAVPTATNCDAVRANPGGAQTLLTQAQQTQIAVATVYGDSLRGGAPVVPISGSATQSAINAQIATLRAAFVGYGVTALQENVVPVAATIVNGPGSIGSIASDTAYGLDYPTLGGTRRAGIGDVDLTASFLLLNTLGQRPAQWLTATQFGMRSQVTAGWRFGSAGADRTGDAFDVPVGDGANAFLARSTTDILFNKQLWISGTLRVVQPLQDQVATRRPLFEDTALFIPSRVQHAQRTLGRRLELEIVPRWSIGHFIGLSGGYLVRRSDANRFSFAAVDSLGAVEHVSSAETLHAYMFGATFSTMSSYLRGRAKWPVEVIYVHTAPVSGQGRAVPATSSDRLELRVYTGYPRR